VAGCVGRSESGSSFRVWGVRRGVGLLEVARILIGRFCGAVGSRESKMLWECERRRTQAGRNRVGLSG